MSSQNDKTLITCHSSRGAINKGSIRVTANNGDLKAKPCANVKIQLGKKANISKKRSSAPKHSPVKDMALSTSESLKPTGKNNVTQKKTETCTNSKEIFDETDPTTYVVEYFLMTL